MISRDGRIQIDFIFDKHLPFLGRNNSVLNIAKVFKDTEPLDICT